MRGRNHGLVSTLASLGRIHQDLSDVSGELLREYCFGSDVELVHNILIEPAEESVVFTSSHLFTISVGPDFADSKEISIAARFVVRESDCSTAVVIRTSPAESGAESLKPEVCLHEETAEGTELEAVLDFLRSAVRGLGDLAQPLGPSMRRSDET